MGVLPVQLTRYARNQKASGNLPNSGRLNLPRTRAEAGSPTPLSVLFTFWDTAPDVWDNTLSVVHSAWKIIRGVDDEPNWVYRGDYFDPPRCLALRKIECRQESLGQLSREHWIVVAVFSLRFSEILTRMSVPPRWLLLRKPRAQFNYAEIPALTQRPSRP